MWKWMGASLLLSLTLLSGIPAAAQDNDYDILYTISSDESNAIPVAQINAVSGESTPVATLHNPGSDAGWSPDGRFIYLVNNANPNARTLTLVDMQDDSRQLITDDLLSNDCLLPLWWSADGKYLAYLTGHDPQDTLYLLDTATGKSESLPSPMDSWTYYSPIWSPSGRYLAYGLTDATAQQHTMVFWDVEKHRAAFTPDEGWSSDAVWSPVGDRLASTPGNNSGVIVFNAQGGQTMYDGDYVSDWSPDGHYLAIISKDDPVSSQATIVDVIHNTTQTFDGYISHDSEGWTPDSQQVLYELFDDQNPQHHTTYLYDPAAGKRTLFTDEPINAERPWWSPDGQYVAFTEALRDSHLIDSFWVFDLAAQKSRHFDIEVQAIQYDTPMAWSPDGRKLMVWSVHDGLLIFDHDEWSPHQIEASLPRASSPRWSADSRYLAFMQSGDDFWDIDVTDMQDFQTRNLTNSPDQYESIIGWRGTGDNQSLIFCGEG